MGRPRKRPRCRTVALVGVDGSGKTSLAKALLNDPPLPIKYLYMGASIESSNIALPSSRLAHRWKVYRYNKALRAQGRHPTDQITLDGVEHQVDRRGRLAATLRLFRRVSEEAYRQLVSWTYQGLGFVVLYDRHFVFDALPLRSDHSEHRLSERLHHWFLRNLYPKPALAVFLDAPTTVLLSRKQDVPKERLQRDRGRILEQRALAGTFVHVDATLAQEEVVRTVRDLIAEHCSEG